MSGATVLRFPTRFDDSGDPWESWVDERRVARHFGVSDRTVRRWTAAGMPSRRYGGSRRFRLSQCEAWHAEEARQR